MKSYLLFTKYQGLMSDFELMLREQTIQGRVLHGLLDSGTAMVSLLSFFGHQQPVEVTYSTQHCGSTGLRPAYPPSPLAQQIA